MKILTSKVSIAMLSIGLFMGSTEILNGYGPEAPKPEVKTADASGKKVKDSNLNKGPTTAEQNSTHQQKAVPKDSATKAKSPTSSTLSLSSITQPISDLSTAVTKSFKDATTSISRAYNQDYSLSSAERNSLQKNVDTLLKAIKDDTNQYTENDKQQARNELNTYLNKPKEGSTIHRDLQKQVADANLPTQPTNQPAQSSAAEGSLNLTATNKTTSAQSDVSPESLSRAKEAAKQQRQNPATKPRQEINTHNNQYKQTQESANFQMLYQN